MEIGQYKLKARMHFAQQLLRKGVSAKEVAMQLDYASASAFSNAFKKYFNLSPSEWLNTLHPQ
jgi:AraC-like DNA-binding protein